MLNAQMKLLAFRVTNFRSVHDSGWIDAGEVTALIGTNESGKTNLMVPLWKLRPAKDGEIKLITDAPRKDYNSYRLMEKKPVFITARFQLSDVLANQIAKLAGEAVDKVRTAEVTRSLSGEYGITFPEAAPARKIAKTEIEREISGARTDIDPVQPVSPPDTALKTSAVGAIDAMIAELGKMPDQIGHQEVATFKTSVAGISMQDAPQESMVAARLKQLANAINARADQLGKATPNDNAEARKIVQDNLPAFVYYTTYGNLDSEIYLPHVIADLKRTDLTGRAEARARTLRVLFDFVRLKPEEILELGKDVNEQAGKATDDQIKAFAEKKKERSVLLQSASTELTQKFREWWKQGQYRLRFEADGNHFRIWVSDDKRPEEIELEGRSTGLQWFLSFYLIFLVESKAAHNGAILILDEPGHTLHPLAQRDLSMFFESLAETNQLLYTSHSPFLIDADHLDRVRAVYVDGQGHTVASTNLRDGQDAAQTKSIYPVHAALGLSVSDTMFQGCKPIIVEGQSDQLYLSAIKTILIREDLIKPSRELLFVPTSGAKAIKTVASILGGKDDDLPLVLCDGDDAGTTLAKNLKETLYKDMLDRVLLITDFVKLAGAEVEDLFPKSFMVPLLDRYLKGPNTIPFDVTDIKRSIIPEIKGYAKAHSIALDEGWKVDVARLVKARLASVDPKDNAWKDSFAAWQKLFATFSANPATTPAA
jgi:energy-coupling factor transporter ATP-binding protein EcfA2/5S rRNA maturation endonuclease (ribonuclease M5)